MTSIARQSKFRHLLALLAGLVVFALVLFCTGNSGPQFAIGSCVGAVCLVYLATHAPSLRRPGA